MFVCNFEIRCLLFLVFKAQEDFKNVRSSSGGGGKKSKQSSAPSLSKPLHVQVRELTSKRRMIFMLEVLIGMLFSFVLSGRTPFVKVDVLVAQILSSDND